MRQQFVLAMMVICISFGQGYNRGQAAVVVLANRAEEDVRFTVSFAKSTFRSYTIVKGDVIALPVMRDIVISFSAGERRNRFLARRNEIYYFLGSAKQLQLKQVGFNDTWSQPQLAPPEDSEERVDQPAVRSDIDRESKDRPVLKVPVKLLVDQAEPRMCRMSGRKGCAGV